MRDRGQAYTIQGVIGAILVASALVFGLQAVDISPWTEDGSEAQTEALRVQTQDLLAAASDRDALRTAATCIDGDGNGTPHPAVAAGTVANETERDALGTLLNRTLVATDGLVADRAGVSSVDSTLPPALALYSRDTL